ncbi:MAG: methionine ABC transporter ATP-binding protein [Oscillospiraceae bacterium]|nr:methionine ABC transporter ATP-binding protein [Oscillospiraceae bacterium]
MSVVIQTKGLYKRFGDVSVLEDIHLEIGEGEIFGIIGKSGAGKSTLVRCINYLEKPTSGSIAFDGRELSGLTKPELYKARQSMGMIFQQFNLLMQRSALGNIRFPMEVAGWKKKDAVARARELLELVGIPDKAESYPSQLSGGQRQRVAIARAIALNPKILLCDEATSAIDPETSRGVLSLLRDINRRFGITIVVITHEMQVIESLCTRVAVLDKSRIVETGIVSEVFANPKNAATRRLIYPDGDVLGRFSGMSGRCCRIVFDGSSSFEPVIADLVLHFRQRINIMFADTRNIDGKAYGQMVVQLPEGGDIAARMLEYIKQRGLSAEEVSDIV